MKLVLTESQACLVVGALEWAQDPNYPVSDPINKGYQRIIDKINKQLKEKRV